MTGDARLVIVGQARDARPEALASPTRVTLGEDDFTIAVQARAPVTAAYRDVSTLAVDQGRALLVLGNADVRMFLERLGSGLGTLLRELRERRTRQLLADRLIQVPDDAIEMVEYAAAGDHGVGHLVYHDWGAVLAPLDERRAWRAFRRAEVGAVSETPGSSVRIDPIADGPLDAVGAVPLELLALGADAHRHRERWTALRDAAATDAAGIVAQLMPDAPFGARAIASALLIDGRPTAPAELREAWPLVEAAVLSEPVYAETYEALLAVAGDDAPSWLAIAPATPGEREAKAWFFVTLPGNLVAMELVTEGAHATYCFRVVPRAAYRGEGPRALAGAAREAVREISAALVDARFLREPIALPARQLAAARHLRYRLALAALPSLAAARRRFVARLIHRDEAAWRGGLVDLVAWHAAARDDDAEWPGRSIEDSAAEEMAANGGEALGDAHPNGHGSGAGAVREVL